MTIVEAFSRLVDRATASLPRHIVGLAGIWIAFTVIDRIFQLEIPEGNRDIALVILGIVLGWADRVFNFHFGSSDGSKRKTEIQKDLTEQLRRPAPYRRRSRNTLGPDPSSRPDLSGSSDTGPDYNHFPETSSRSVDEPD